ncbi:hypothetical protein KVD72_02430 [Helicobacter pylori]|nr:hypothetical protein KVD72_02430 [Helicobacter pylori]
MLQTQKPPTLLKSCKKYKGAKYRRAIQKGNTEGQYRGAAIERYEGNRSRAPNRIFKEIEFLKKITQKLHALFAKKQKSAMQPLKRSSNQH